MQFKKENKISKGRPKGAINKTTSETKEIIKNLVSNEVEKISELLEQLTPKERIDALIRLLPYIIPRQSEIVVDAVIDKPRTTITWGTRTIEV